MTTACGAIAARTVSGSWMADRCIDCFRETHIRDLKWFGKLGLMCEPCLGSRNPMRLPLCHQCNLPHDGSWGSYCRKCYGTGSLDYI
jgi:hypothetical protein